MSQAIFKLRNEDPFLVVDGEMPKCHSFKNLAVIEQPRGENPILRLMVPLGISGVRAILFEFDKWRAAQGLEVVS